MPLLKWPSDPDALDALSGAEGIERGGERRAVGERQIRVELEQRDEHETALGEVAVRDRQALGGVLEVSEQQHVDVDRARAVARAAEHPPLLDLDRLADVEQLLGLERGADPAPPR